MAISQQDIDTAKKIKIENQLNTQLDKVYSLMTANVVLAYDNNTDASHPVAVYTTAIAGLLSAFYLQTIGVFSKATNALITPETQTYKEFQEIADLDFTGETTVSDIISQVNDEEMLLNLSTMNNYVSTSAQQIENTNIKQVQEIALQNLSTKDFKQKLTDNFDARTDTISQTTVQHAAESTKQNKLKTVNSKVKDELGKPDDKPKSWQTILDGREREAHGEADGQVQDVNNPFVVGGELLKFPGDTSLGATLGNIINCRCSMHLVF